MRAEEVPLASASVSDFSGWGCPLASCMQDSRSKSLTQMSLYDLTHAHVLQMHILHRIKLVDGNRSGRDQTGCSNHSSAVLAVLLMNLAETMFHLDLSRSSMHITFLAVRTGRVPTILLFKVIGVNLMGFMGMFPQIWTKLGVIIPVYVIRTAIINSAYPLQKSILMDYVPKVRLSQYECSQQ